jgi:hypothetical protein
MQDTKELTIKDQTANPAPLGLLAFGMTTVLLNLHNLGLLAMSGMILSMGIFYGGLAQVIAGVLEWKKGNTFGTLAFTSYGMFWLSLVFLVVAPKTGLVAAADPASMAAFLSLWGVFTLLMFVGTLKHDRMSQLIFGSLTLLFFLLAAAELTGSASVLHVAAIVGLICGASAMAGGMKQVLCTASAH